MHQSGDQFSLRIPMVVGPRYNPAPVVQTVDLRTGDNGWGSASNDPVPDRDRISPPVLDPRDHAPINSTTISIRLQAGFPLGEVKSHFHNVKIDGPTALHASSRSPTARFRRIATSSSPGPARRRKRRRSGCFASESPAATIS